MAKNSSADQLIPEIIGGIRDIKGEKIHVLDMRELGNMVCDFFVICQGNSNTQVSAICQTVEKRVSKVLKEKPLHTEGLNNAEWVLIDYANVIVHIFQRHIRERFCIEELWGDAKQQIIN